MGGLFGGYWGVWKGILGGSWGSHWGLLGFWGGSCFERPLTAAPRHCRRLCAAPAPFCAASALCWSGRNARGRPKRRSERRQNKRAEITWLSTSLGGRGVGGHVVVQIIVCRGHVVCVNWGGGNRGHVILMGGRSHVVVCGMGGGTSGSQGGVGHRGAGLPGHVVMCVTGGAVGAPSF